MNHPLLRFLMVPLCAILLSPALARAEPATAPAATAPVAEPPPAQVLVLGTFHFSNPGLDLHNMAADDVLAPGRQAEIAEIVAALARFAPTVVAVEWPAALVDERYAKFRAGELAPSRNEVVQLGFRLADARDLARVHGIDVDGDFPYAAVMAWATANGRADDLAAAQARVGAQVAATGALLGTHTLASVLRQMNEPGLVADGQARYLSLLRYGAGDEQPGVELNAAWARRNLGICARLLQALAPGDRAVVVYGAGHAHALQRCAIEAPGVELVDVLDYLPPARLRAVATD